MSARVRVPVGLVAGALAALAVVAACFSEHAADLTALPADCQNLAKTLNIPSGNVIIGIQNFAFVPGNATIARGKTVTWVNCEAAGTAGHTVTSDSGGTLASSVLTRGQTYSQTFSGAGTFAYHCAPHPFMQAKVTVQ